MNLSISHIGMDLVLFLSILGLFVGLPAFAFWGYMRYCKMKEKGYKLESLGLKQIAMLVGVGGLFVLAGFLLQRVESIPDGISYVLQIMGLILISPRLWMGKYYKK